MQSMKAERSKKKLFRQLKFKIIAVTLLMSIAPLIFLGGLIYYQFATVMAQRVKDQLWQLSRGQSNAIDVFLRERTNILTTLVSTHTFQELRQQENLSRLFQVLVQNSQGLGLVDLGVIDEDGQHLAYVGPYSLQGLNYFQQPWFSAVMSRGRYISDVYLGFRQLPHFIIAVRGHDNGLSWILRATIDSDVFNSLVRTAHTGETGDAYILNREGIHQTQPRFEGKVLEKANIDVKKFGEGTTAVEIQNKDGESAYYAGAWFKNNQWLFISSQNKIEKTGGLVEARDTEIIVVVSGCLAIILATIFITNLTISHLEAADSERDKLNAQLIQSDKLAALGKMAAGIAHEINNPLAVIGEKAGWMKDLLGDEEFQRSENFVEYKTSVDKIEEHVERARKITHNMLGFARRMEPRLDDVDINHTIDQVIDFLENSARSNNIEIQTDFQENIPVIASDQSQLQQVFLNLITNAIDAIEKNGCIEIATRQKGDFLEVAVKDDGPGIPREQQARIFDPFYTTKMSGKGTGLGLSVSHSIIEKMGGTITFESIEKTGTTFTVKLPVVLPEKK
jgi:two-component system NtrC family sensor kinase